MRIAVVVLVLSAFCSIARADDFLKSSPGELATAHASLDAQDKCTTCHEPDNSLSANKCLSCHEHQDLKKRIDKNEGFHVSVKVKGVACKLCHQEHRGRKFDLMGWRAIGGEAAFDHKLTGFELKGKHAATKCAKCHTTVDKQGLRTYMGTDRTCGSCHSKNQPHGAIRPAMMKCDRCHTESVWNPQKTQLDFNHDDKAQAAMPLEGSHEDVACVKCHPKASFKLVKFDGECLQCHKSPHDGQLFGTKKCTACHSASLRTLSDVRFDHKKDAGYALQGKHAQLSCATCHTKALGKTKPTPGCENCHAKSNKHGTRFQAFPACSTCHSQRGWKTTMEFDHADKAEWKLTGKHNQVKCRDCHRGKSPSDFERFDVKANGCMSCHRHKDAHGGKYKNNECVAKCHVEAGVLKIKDKGIDQFHGPDSNFPLRGGHATRQCEMCHTDNKFEALPTECGGSCHEDSLHAGKLGQECSRCHEPGQWPAVRFDHTKDTKWPLDGKHAAVKDCGSCHPARAYTGTPTTCGASGCHQKDDVHKGKLGTACEKCHRVDKQITFQHNRDAQFKIDGKHTPLLCASCHKSIAFKPVRPDCVGCHAEPAIHKGRYGTACEKCHSTTSFTDIRAQHDVGDFSLTGAHDQLACARCHPNGEKLRGSGNLCINCHRKDDIHNNGLSPRCGECHDQRAFAPARFDHMSTGCGLTGLHATLPCADCHKAGNYGAVSPVCASCHRADALRKGNEHRTFTDCATCHNPTAWIPAKGIGQQTVCR